MSAASTIIDAPIAQITCRKKSNLGSTLKVTMHYDNSRANRFNPDPTAAVRWGEQTWEEMMLGYYGTIELPGSTATRTRRQ